MESGQMSILGVQKCQRRWHVHFWLEIRFEGRRSPRYFPPAPFSLKGRIVGISQAHALPGECNRGERSKVIFGNSPARCCGLNSLPWSRVSFLYVNSKSEGLPYLCSLLSLISNSQHKILFLPYTSIEVLLYCSAAC